MIIWVSPGKLGDMLRLGLRHVGLQVELSREFGADYSD